FAGRFGVTHPPALVPARGDLVLRLPGRYQGRLREMSLEGEVDSLERALARAPENLDRIEQLVAGCGDGAALDDPAGLDQIPNHYVPGCREHCALAHQCKAQALRCGDPVVIHPRAREELAAAGSLRRTLQLLRGGADPEGAEERELQARLQAALTEYEE